MSAPFIKLKRPCPHCQGVLERYEAQAVAGQPPEHALPRVRCANCGRDWNSLRDVLLEAHGVDPSAPPKAKHRVTMADLRSTLGKIKAGVRAGRNVAGSVRAISESLVRIAGRVRQMEKAPDKQEVIAQVGQDVEGIVDQVALAVDHIDEGRTGKIGQDPNITIEVERDDEHSDEDD